MNSLDKMIQSALRQYEEKTCDPSPPSLPVAQQCMFVCPKPHRAPRVIRDPIALEENTASKRAKLASLQRVNQQLKIEYEESVRNSHHLEGFLRQIEFTFKGAADKGLWGEAKEATDAYLKLMKGKPACEKKEANAYILVLNNQLAKLQGVPPPTTMKEDFNRKEKQLYDRILNTLHSNLQSACHATTLHHLSHKVQLLQIQNKLRNRDINHRRKVLSALNEETRNCLLEVEGLKYQKLLLQKRVKDCPKETQALSDVQKAIVEKREQILLHNKALVQKKKTYDYRQQWTKELKQQLQDKKNEHLQEKSKFETIINTLSEQYEQYNAKYKIQIIEQVTKKKTKDFQQKYVQQTHLTAVSQAISYESILPITKPLAMTIFSRNMPLEAFINSLLPQDMNHKSLSKALLPYDSSTLLTRYLLEDTTDRVTIFQILKHLLSRNLKYGDIPSAKIRISTQIKKHGEAMRSELKGETNLDGLYKVLIKFIGEEYAATEALELLQYMMWEKYQNTQIYSAKQIQEIFLLLSNDKQRETEQQTEQEGRGVSNDNKESEM